MSTGIPSRETPDGSFRAFRMEEDHYSKEFDDAPMPHSIFFTKVGHAIHGTDSVGRLGTPASHGCVRLSRQNASTLYALVQEQGVLNTTVTLTGSAQVALARNPRGRTNNAVARAQQPAEEQYATLRRSRESDAAGAARPSLHAAGRQLHLSGRRQRHRRALSGAAPDQPPLWRAGLSAAAAAAAITTTQGYSQQGYYYQRSSRGSIISRAAYYQN